MLQGISCLPAQNTMMGEEGGLESWSGGGVGGQGGARGVDLSCLGGIDIGVGHTKYQETQLEPQVQIKRDRESKIR